MFQNILFLIIITWVKSTEVMNSLIILNIRPLIKYYNEDVSVSAGAGLLCSSHQHYDAFMQRAGGFQCLFLSLHGVLPLHTALDERLRLHLVSLRVEDETVAHLTLNRCGTETGLNQQLQSFISSSVKEWHSTLFIHL